MSSSVQRELEELKAMLDTPKRSFVPLSSYERVNSPKSNGEGLKVYTHALSSAEKSVDRLGRAIEAAEEEMEAALKRTTNVHKNQLKQKELEVHELNRVVAAKERSIDSLRDTLATTKRTFESRLSQAESALALKDAEIKTLQEELRFAKQEREVAAIQIEKQSHTHRAVEVEFHAREQDLSDMLRSKSEDATKHLMALKYERKEKDDIRALADDLRRQVGLLQEDIRLLKEENILAKERHEAEMEEMRRRLKSEKNLRKACEKWLRSELKSREEMELLLGAVKDAATGKVSASDAAEVEALIDNLRLQGAAASAVPACRSPGGTSYSRTCSPRREVDKVREKLEEDNARLKSELLLARKMINSRVR